MTHNKKPLDKKPSNSEKYISENNKRIIATEDNKVSKEDNKVSNTLRPPQRKNPDPNKGGGDSDGS